MIGRLTKDPELKQAQSGVSVCSFTLAVDRRYQKEGEERQADFISCVAWRNTADFIAKFFSKGARIALEGSIQSRSWKDGDGNKRYVTEVIAEHAEFCESRKDCINAQTVPQAQTVTMPNAPQGDIDGFMPLNYEEDDLPF